jgi:hypothetical protein
MCFFRIVSRCIAMLDILIILGLGLTKRSETPIKFSAGDISHDRGQSNRCVDVGKGGEISWELTIFVEHEQSREERTPKGSTERTHAGQIVRGSSFFTLRCPVSRSRISQFRPSPSSCRVQKRSPKNTPSKDLFKDKLI